MDKSDFVTLNESFGDAFSQAFASDGIFALFMTLGIMLVIALYVYYALAWQQIGRNQKYKKSWLAWIPFANVSMILQMGRFHWAWVFLFLVPLLGWLAIWILLIIAQWRIYEKSSYPGWLSLAGLLPEVGGVAHLIIVGLVAWRKNGKKKAVKRKVRKK